MLFIELSDLCKVRPNVMSHILHKVGGLLFLEQEDNQCVCSGLISVIEMKIWIFWSESNSRIYFYIFLNKNWKIYWSERSFTGLGSKYRWSLPGLEYYCNGFPPFEWLLQVVVQVHLSPWINIKNTNSTTYKNKISPIG